MPAERIDWDLIFRRLATVAHVGPREARRLTFSQAINLIRAEDEAGARAAASAGREIRSQADLDAMLEAARSGELVI